MKYCALTFDDGPSNTMTPPVLEKLEKYNVKATFMQIGKYINESTAELEKKIVSLGHEIGNHSWSTESLTSFSDNEIAESIEKTSMTIENYSGKRPVFFRAPNLAFDSRVMNAVKMPFVNGVVAYDWSGAGPDGSETSAEQRARFVLDGVKDGSIILMHDNQKIPHPTPQALDIIIPSLKSQGYEFVTLSQLFKIKKTDPFSLKDRAWDCV